MRKYDHARLHPYADVQKSGREGELRAELEARKSGQEPSDTCVMLYTSGTTGRPKGVVLSNTNIIATAKASSEFDDLQAGARAVVDDGKLTMENADALGPRLLRHALAFPCH